MTINPAIFKSYDIRGLYPEDINEENIHTIVQAICQVFKDKIGKDKMTVALCRDMRLSGPSLYPIVIKAIQDFGFDVVDIGLLATSSLYFATYHYKYDAGIMLSASHNPPQYTGMKMVIRSEKGLIKIGKTTGMEDVKNYSLRNKPIQNETKGTLTLNGNVLKDELENAKQIIDITTIKPFKVVADPGNGMGSTYITEFFNHVPNELIKMNFELDGSFPVHQPDPMQPKNLVYLQKKVLEEKADLGLAPDGDGDRMFIIDENGQVVSPSIISSIIAKQLLTKNPGAKFVMDLKYYLTFKQNLEENGGELLISKTGHAFITELMTQSGAIFAGEASAHYYYASTGNAESQIITIAAVLEILSKENKPLSEVAEEYRRSFESGEVNFEFENTAMLMDKIKEKYSDGTLGTLDGITIDYPEWRMSVRNSNTEPLLRVNLEAKTKEIMETEFNKLLSFIEGFGAKKAGGH